MIGQMKLRPRSRLKLRPKMLGPHMSTLSKRRLTIMKTPDSTTTVLRIWMTRIWMMKLMKSRRCTAKVSDLKRPHYQPKMANLCSKVKREDWW